jgi:hypothetical protein
MPGEKPRQPINPRDTGDRRPEPTRKEGIPRDQEQGKPERSWEEKSPKS